MNLKPKKPPRLFLRLLHLFAQPEEKFPIVGDLEEEYHSHCERWGQLRTDFWYRWQVFKILFTILFHKGFGSISLAGSLLILTLRKIRREKISSLINITGLAVGMACFILIFLWVRDELSFDRFHHNASQIHRVAAEHAFSSGKLLGATTPAPLAPALQQEFSEIEAAVRLFPSPRLLVRHQNQLFYESAGLLVSPTFFDVFTVEFIQGNPKTALKDLFSIVITEDLAAKYFGDDDPLGKTFRVENILDLKVTGVIRKPRPNSHLQFQYLMPFLLVRTAGGVIDRWGENAFFTYIRLTEGISPAQTEAKISGYIKKQLPDSVTILKLQPLTQIYLNSRAEGDIARLGDIRYIYIFTTVAFFVLLIACINFMNLSTARSGNRAMEVGIRKVIGAKRRDLCRQFLGESIMTAFLALLLAFWLIILLLPIFSQLSGKDLSWAQMHESLLFLLLLGVALVTGLISGIYPALVLSSFRPVKVLRGVFTLSGRGTAFRRILVVAQFALSVFLLISTYIVHHQVKYIQQKKLGYEKENLLYFRLGRDPQQYYDQIKTTLKTHPEVLGITTTNQLPTAVINSTGNVQWLGKNPEELILFHELMVEYDYFQTMGLELTAGRVFSPNYPSDADKAYIINEKAAAMISTGSTVGAPLTVGDKKGHIIGVIKDFHFRSLNHEIKPLVISYIAPSMFDILLVRISGQNIPETLKSIESMWKEVVAAWPFEFNFLDQEFDLLYQSEARMAKLFDYFTILSIFIACLGLFGLAVYFSQQRTKEIGIRKILGATVWEIYSLLSQEYLRWVLIANLIAWPAAFLFMRHWLTAFAYQTRFPWEAFVWGPVSLLLVAVITVSFQAIKAARSNPANSLRDE